MAASRQRSTYVLVFDGGSRGNPGRSYGSFRMERRGGPRSRPVRLDFGSGTNNQAEYQALIAGLHALLDHLRADGVVSQQVQLEVRGDSLLVLRQVEGVWKTKEPRLRPLRDEAAELLGRFGRVELRHQPRRRSVAILGH